jgi:hypothetical protein
MMITKERNAMSEETLVRSPAMSFIVRVWSGSDDKSQLRGEIEYLSTGEKRFFPDYGALLRLIDGWRQDIQTEH